MQLGSGASNSSSSSSSSGSLAYEPWPQADESLLVQTTYKLPVQVGACREACLVAACTPALLPDCVVLCQPRREAQSGHDAPLLTQHPSWPGVQVNGKMRGTIEVGVDTSQDEAVAAAQTVAAVSKQLDGKPVKKVIFVQGKILNIIVGK